jgi:hypothetical protein
MTPCGQVFAERISRLDVLPARIVWLLTPSAARPHYALHERITLAARIESSHKRFDALAGAWRFEVLPSESMRRTVGSLALRGTLSRVSAAAIAATLTHTSAVPLTRSATDSVSRSSTDASASAGRGLGLPGGGTLSAHSRLRMPVRWTGFHWR